MLQQTPPELPLLPFTSTCSHARFLDGDPERLMIKIEAIRSLAAHGRKAAIYKTSTLPSRNRGEVINSKLLLPARRGRRNKKCIHLSIVSRELSQSYPKAGRRLR